MNEAIVDKVLSGLATQDEAKSVACWFEHPQGSMDLVERIDHDLNQEWDKQYTHPMLRVSWKHWVWRAACCLLIVIGTFTCGYSVYHHYIQPVPVSEQVAYAARGERTHLVLQDGTRIYLNSDSRITFPSRFSLTERRIRLDGEAYFEVTKNAHRPFIVEMGNAAVTVLGTRFNAQSYAGSPVSITLDEGSIQFDAPMISPVRLVPGERIEYDPQVAKAQVSKTTNQTASAWRNHRIDVNNVPMEQMIQMLERTYDVTFVVHNAKCYRHSFTLSLDDYSLREVLNRMDRLSPVVIRYNESKRQVDVY